MPVVTALLGGKKTKSNKNQIAKKTKSTAEESLHGDRNT